MVKESLNAFEVERVCGIIWKAMEEEYEQLQLEVEHLQVKKKERGKSLLEFFSLFFLCFESIFVEINLFFLIRYHYFI